MVNAVVVKLPDQPLVHHTFYLFGNVAFLDGYRIVEVIAKHEGNEIGLAAELRHADPIYPIPPIIVKCTIGSEDAPDQLDCDVHYIEPTD